MNSRLLSFACLTLALLCLATARDASAGAGPGPLGGSPTLSAAGASVPEYRPVGAPEPGSVLWEAARALLTLGVVLLLLVFGLKFLRHWVARAGHQGASDTLQILARVPLTPKESLCLVRIGTELLLVGTSPAGVTLLHRLEAGQIGRGSAPASPEAPARSGSPGFSVGFRLSELAARLREIRASGGSSEPAQTR
jgi:flagellar biosynthetic protein FliO